MYISKFVKSVTTDESIDIISVLNRGVRTFLICYSSGFVDTARRSELESVCQTISALNPDYGMRLSSKLSDIFQQEPVASFSDDIP